MEEFGDVDQALIGFYEDTLQEVMVQTDISQRRLRTWFDTQLITPARTRDWNIPLSCQLTPRWHVTRYKMAKAIRHANHSHLTVGTLRLVRYVLVASCMTVYCIGNLCARAQVTHPARACSRSLAN